MMFKKLGFGLLAFATLSIHALGNDYDQPVRTVKKVDAAKYVGRWYQISANPMPFEAGCICSQQTLKIVTATELSVYNSCNRNSVDGPFTDIYGTAYNDEPETNSKFTVDFGLGFPGKYWIIAVDWNYRWAVVTDPARKSLYILSKTPKLSSWQYRRAVRAAKKQIDTSKLVMMNQENCNYPPEA